MSFDVFPSPPTAPLKVGPGGASPFIDFQERAQLDPADGTTKMYIAVAASGDSCAPPGPPVPVIILQADSGTAVAVSDGQPTMIPGSAGAVVGRATVAESTGDVTVIEVELLATSNSWQINFENPDPASLRRFTWVVADNAAEARQPWIDAPSALGFGPTPVGQMTTAPLVVANRGTAPLTIADQLRLPLGPGFFLAAVPGPIDPGTCGTLLIRFVGMSSGPFTGIYSIGNDDARATQAPGHNELVTMNALVVGPH